MKKFAIALGIVVAAAGAAVAYQDGMGGKDQEPPPMPKPGKEHELLKQMEGTFDCVTKFWMDPSQPPMEGKGTNTCKIALGGFWSIFDFKSEGFEGHGTMGYDPVKKKYVATWIDSMMPALFVAEGDADAAGKVFTFMLTGRDPMTNEPTKEKWVFDVKDKDSHVSTFFKLNEKSGKYEQTGEIKYTRKK